MSAPARSPEDLVRALDERITRRRQRHVPAIASDRRAFRLAAAVLTAFHLPGLKPWRENESDPPATNPMVLVEDVVPAPGVGRVALRADVRREALAALGTPERIRGALAANPDRVGDDFQRLFEQWLLGGPPRLDQQVYADLTRSAQIVTWLEGIWPGSPSAGEVQAALDRRSVYALFEHLASDTFTGREDELAALREYAAVLGPSTTVDAVSRQLRAWLGLKRRPPLVIEGVGGVGKSALLGRFLTEHVNAQAEVRFPFAYLAFDSPALRVDEPATLISEIVRQLRLLHSEHGDLIDAFRDALRIYGQGRSALRERTGDTDRGQRSRRILANEVDLYREFGRVVTRIAERGRASAPFLLVLDSFEEAQFRGDEALRGLMRMLEEIHAVCPMLRIVISTRSPFTARLPSSLGRTSRLTLSELPEALAVQLLRRLGVEDPQLAEAAARQVRGNPLNLTLAARLLRAEARDSDGIGGLRTRSWLLFAVSDEMIRGQLYARILDHIHDERVRRLAHPGMVLRRVTAEIIQRVLSGPCEVPVKDLRDARALFEELAREHTLVIHEADDVLRYRSDIRAPTLALLQQDRPEHVRRIHAGAVEYYAGRQGTAARAEEAYHRLALDQEPWQIESLLREPEASKLLADSLPELPPRARVWLAARIGADVPPELRRHAAVADWERVVGQKVSDLLRYRDVEDAIRLLRERPERSQDSPLFVLEAKTHILLDDWHAAESVLRHGVDAMGEKPNRGRMAELLWLSAQVAERMGRPDEADEVLARAQDVARGIDDPLCTLQILAQRVLLRRGRRGADADVSTLLETLARTAGQLRPDQIDRERNLVRTVAALLGPAYPGQFRAIIAAVGVGEITEAQRAELTAVLEQAWTRGEANALEDSFASDLARSDLPLDHLLPSLLDSALASVLIPRLAKFLAPEPRAFAAANLAGIEAYREAWELQSSRELA